MQLRLGGGLAGHNGLRSIASTLGTQEFARLRIGIGRDDGADAIDRVLGRFTPRERELLPQVVVAAADAAVGWLDDGFVAASNMANAWKPPDEESNRTESAER